MRDFNSGDIVGDVNIIDNSNNNQFKLLIHCDNEELLQEEVHRWGLVKKEINQRVTGVLWVFAFALCCYSLLQVGISSRAKWS